MTEALTVMLIDDDEDDHQIFGEALGWFFPNAIFKTTFNCPEAIEQFELSRVPDFIFLDYNIHNMNAPDCLMNMRHIPGIENSEIILLTGMVPDHDLKNLQSLGISKFIEKPGSIKTLAENVADAINVH